MAKQCWGFDAMLDLWPDPLIVVDSAGLLVCFSLAAQRVLSWNETQCQGNSAHERLCVQTREHFHSAANCPFQQPETSTGWKSVFWCTGNGDYLSVDVRATLLRGDHSGYTAWSLVDNSERIHNNAEFEKFAHFVELSPAPIAEFDAQGQILFANRAMQALMVSAGFDNLGKSDVLPKNLEAACQSYLMPSGVEPPEFDSAVVALEGCFIKWHFGVLDNFAGASTLIGYAFDVTEQQRVQQALEEAKRVARRDFYAKMIHELRTPLNAIMGFSDLLLARSQTKLSARECKNLQAIKNAGFQLNELVTDTLDISKIEAGFMTLDRAEFDVTALCNTFLPQIESLAAAKNLTFETVLPKVAVMKSDQQKVRQILINLLSNAIKYTRQGAVTLTVKLSDGCIRFSIADTGVGIPDAQKHKLFGNYSQIDDAQNAGICGTGLGLALVGELVKLLKGEVAVQSEYSQGSEFIVTLPLQS